MWLTFDVNPLLLRDKPKETTSIVTCQMNTLDQNGNGETQLRYNIIHHPTSDLHIPFMLYVTAMKMML